MAKAAGAKFAPYRKLQKAIDKLRKQFEKQMAGVIKKAANPRASRLRAQETVAAVRRGAALVPDLCTLRGPRRRPGPRQLGAGQAAQMRPGQAGHGGVAAPVDWAQAQKGCGAAAVAARAAEYSTPTKGTAGATGAATVQLVVETSP